MKAAWWVLGMAGALLPVGIWADAGHEGMAHDMAGMDMGAAMPGMAAPNVKATIVPAGEIVANRPVSLTLMLRDKNNRPLTPADLEVVHEHPVHVFLIDGAFVDYHHEHPVPGAHDGEWVFDLMPLKSAYKVWVEVKPKDGDDQFVPLQLGGVVANPTALGKEQVLTANAQGLRFTLTLSMPLKAGEGTLALINIYDEDGLPVRDLQPIMGAFAHLAGFDGKLESLMHVHPAGAEPENDEARGGPVLNMQLMPHAPGMHRLYLQVKRKGEVITVPFTVMVGG